MSDDSQNEARDTAARLGHKVPLLVACEHCRALPGQPCQTSAGQPSGPHTSRLRLAEALIDAQLGALTR